MNCARSASASSSGRAKASMNWRAERRGRGGAAAGSEMDAASIGLSGGVEGDGLDGEGGRGGHGARPGRLELGGGLGLDDLVEDELAVLDAVSAVVAERRVAVLVDR